MCNGHLMSNGHGVNSGSKHGANNGSGADRAHNGATHGAHIGTNGASTGKLSSSKLDFALLQQGDGFCKSGAYSKALACYELQLKGESE